MEKLFQNRTSTLWNLGSQVRKEQQIYNADDAASELFFSMVQHPNVVQSSRVGIVNPSTYFLEMPKGVPLYNLNDLTMEEALKVFWDVACALKALRDVGLVHSDVKPLNIVVFALDEKGNESDDMDGRSDVVGKLIDMGQIRSYKQNTVRGTRSYYDPQLRLKLDQYDVRALLQSALEVFSRLYRQKLVEWSRQLEDDPSDLATLERIKNEADDLHNLFSSLATMMQSIKSYSYPELYDRAQKIFGQLYQSMTGKRLPCEPRVDERTRAAGELLNIDMPTYVRRYSFSQLYPENPDFEPFAQLWTQYCQGGKRDNFSCDLTKMILLRKQGEKDAKRRVEFRHQLITLRSSIATELVFYPELTYDLKRRRDWGDWIYSVVTGEPMTEPKHMFDTEFHNALSYFH